MLLTFRRWPSVNHFTIKSENIEGVEEDIGHGVIITKDGNKIDVWEKFQDVVNQVNAAMEKDAAVKNNKPEEKKEETISVSDLRAMRNAIFGK